MLASAFLTIGALTTWTLSRPEVPDSGPLVRGLHALAFTSGGTAHVAALGLLVAGIAVPVLLLHLLPRALALAGLVLAVLADLSILALAFEPAAVLLPLARFPILGGCWPPHSCSPPPDGALPVPPTLPALAVARPPPDSPGRAGTDDLDTTGGGAVVTMAPTAGLEGVSGLAAYSAATAAVIALTRVAALDHGGQGLRVNALAPGPVLADHLAAEGERVRAQAAQAVPLQRIGTIAEVAAAALWLCSDALSYITGATLTIDGGRTAGSQALRRVTAPALR